MWATRYFNTLLCSVYNGTLFLFKTLVSALYAAIKLIVATRPLTITALETPPIMFNKEQDMCRGILDHPPSLYFSICACTPSSSTHTKGRRFMRLVIIKTKSTFKKRKKKKRKEKERKKRKKMVFLQPFLYWFWRTSFIWSIYVLFVLPPPSHFAALYLLLLLFILFLVDTFYWPSPYDHHLHCHHFT